jgi:hypothetical protein
MVLFAVGGTPLTEGQTLVRSDSAMWTRYRDHCTEVPHAAGTPFDKWQVECNVCQCTIRRKNFAEHMRAKHVGTITTPSPPRPQRRASNASKAEAAKAHDEDWTRGSKKDWGMKLMLFRLVFFAVYPLSLLFDDNVSAVCSARWMHGVAVQSRGSAQCPHTASSESLADFVFAPLLYCAPHSSHPLWRALQASSSILRSPRGGPPLFRPLLSQP